ncbi:MAG: choice-of-anchor D domain-containing protein [Terracidiphilus sp.]
MTRKFWILAAAALNLGLAQNPAIAQSGPPASGDSAAVLFIPGTVNLVAGLNGSGTAGNGGLATAAQLTNPFGVAFDSKGNLYITDSGSDEVRMIDSATGDISLFAGTGSFGNTAPAANAQATTVAIGAVTGLAVDASDNVYFADRQNNVVWKVDTSGVITIFAGTIGTASYTGDTGPATSATLNSPYGLAFDASGNLYIADTANNVVRIVGTNGNINTFAGNGTGASQLDACPNNIPALGSPAPAATKVALCEPYGVAADASGNVYVSSYPYDQVYKVGTNGNISLFAGTGANYGPTNCCESGDGGQATSAELWRPFGLYADPIGDVYIVDQFGSFIREVDTAGVINKVYGDGSGDITKAVLGTPDLVAETFNVGDANGIYFITMDADGNLVVPSTGVILSAGSTGNYFFGYNNYLYNTTTSTSLNGVSSAYPPYITISNPSGVTLSFTGTPTITGPFGIAGGTCSFPGTVAPGDSCTVVPSFTPTVDGAITGSIVIPSNANNVTQSITQNISPLTITLEGTGTGSAPPPAFSLSPSQLTFSSPAGVQSAAQQVTLMNTGQVPFTIFSYGTDNSPNFAASPNTCPTAGSTTTIAVGVSCTINVTFDPTAPTTYGTGLQVCVSSASYSDYCNFSTEGNAVSLSGTGTGTVSFTSPPLAFGGVVAGETSAALSATLNNGGADALTIQSISIIGANPSDYAISTGPNACAVGGTVDGGGLPASTCAIYVTFTPGSAAGFAATLQVTLQDPFTAPPTTYTPQANLTGTGVVFSSNVGTAQAAQSITVNFAAAGTLSSIQALTQGAPNLDFTSATGGTCALNTAYTVGQTCTVNVVFTPQFAGARNSALFLGDAGGDVLSTTYLTDHLWRCGDHWNGICFHQCQVHRCRWSP